MSDFKNTLISDLTARKTPRVEDGTVLRYIVNGLTFAAIWMGDAWYTTGARHGARHSYEQMVDILAAAEKVETASAWDTISENVPAPAPVPTSLGELVLTPNVRACLIVAGITEVSTLLKHSEQQLLDINGIGPGALRMIKTALGRHDLQLADEYDGLVEAMFGQKR